MYFFNYIYFIILTFLGLKFLTQKQVLLKSPLNKSQTMVLSGPEMFWILTFSTGLLALSAPGTLNLMAIRLFVLELFCLLGLFIVRNAPVNSPMITMYGIYIIWLLIGLSYSPAPDYGFRVILKYLYPFLIILFASAVVREKEVFFKASFWARAVGVSSICVFFIPYVSRLFPGVFWYGTASAINYISMCIFSLSLYCFTDEKKKNLFFVVLFMLPCIIWVFRTSIMGTTLALIVFAFFRYKLKSLPVIAGALVIFLVIIFTVPSIREKMFFDESKSISQLESGDITIDDINSNGRFAIWEWSLQNYFSANKIAGSGTGNLQEVFYSLKHPFGTIKICHNDYVQILCDNGLIGIVLFGLSFLFLIGHTFIIYLNKNYDTAIRICAITAGASAAGVLLTMFTDNVINYTMATLSYPCGFYGMMLGMLAKYKNYR